MLAARRESYCSDRDERRSEEKRKIEYTWCEVGSFYGDEVRNVDDEVNSVVRERDSVIDGGLMTDEIETSETCICYDSDSFARLTSGNKLDYTPK